MNRRQITLAGVLVVALISGTWAVARVQESNDNTYSNLERFVQVLARVRDNYVEPVDSDKLMNAAIRGMLGTVDPYSEYRDKEELACLDSSIQGVYGGLGLSISLEEHWLTVISPIEGTPAWRAGIVGGDRIIKIDETSTEGLSLDDAMKKMRGERGTKVKLTILREGRETPLEFEIVRDIIENKSVPYAGMLGKGVGYIRLSTFLSQRSRQEMDAAFDKLEKMHPRGVIIDLRYNPGGLLSQAVEVAEEFTPRGKKIVYTRGRDPSQNRDYFSAADHPHTDYPIVILVNQWTASASEIVSGALQDLDLGLVVGTTTFGKGLVQTTIPLTREPDGPKLKLTTAKYYTPSGRCIQKDAQLKDGALARDDSKPDATADSKTAKPEYKTEMGRAVYGGGGITPDVEMAEVKLPRIMEDLESKQVFFKYAVKYAVKHKDPPANYALTPAMRDEFMQLLRDDKVAVNADSLADAKRWVDNAIRRELGRRYAGDEEAYRIVLEDDDEVTSAAALFDKAPTLPKLLALASELSRGKAHAESPLDAKSVR
jgi:carboxyl-terminal processing protease